MVPVNCITGSNELKIDSWNEKIFLSETTRPMFFLCGKDALNFLIIHKFLIFCAFKMLQLADIYHV